MAMPSMSRYAALSGLWHIEPLAMQGLIGCLKAQTAPLEAQGSEFPKFQRRGNIALLSISGPITKHESFFSFFFGGTSIERLKAEFLSAMNDDSIDSVGILVDSPGGQVAGVSDFADTIFAHRDIKPIFAHIEDLGASAAFHLASQAHTISASPAAEIGSIGTIGTITDSSGLAEQAGVVVYTVISKGAEDHKGAGIPGTAVTEAHLADLQERVDTANGFFLRAIERGRGMKSSEARAVADGRLHGATRAKELGLVDTIQTTDMAFLKQAQQDNTARRRTRIVGRSKERRTKALIRQSGNTVNARIMEESRKRRQNR